MNDRQDLEGIGVPPDLAAIHAELSSLSYEERPSFQPELEAELAREWVRISTHPPTSSRRHLAAAAVIALLLVGLSVPGARASLVRLVSAIQGPPAEVAGPLQPDPGTPPAITVDLPEAALEGDEPETPLVIPSEPPSAPAALERYRGPEATFPEFEDRGRVEWVIREHYPLELQHAGVGGTARLLLWVDSTGAVELVNLRRGSGVPELDRAALQAAPSFRFTPARRRGEAVGAWVEFDVRFRPLPAAGDPASVPRPADPISGPDAPDVLDLSLLPEWTHEAVLTAPAQREAGELLRAAVDDDELLESLGSVESILAANPPSGRGPTRWRTTVTGVLEDAMVRDPDNPAPLLALARIRRKQGLRTEARLLFERGLQRAMRGGEGVSPALLAEFLYERGTLVRESWLSQRGEGRVPAASLPIETCSQARSSGEAVSGHASVERLIAWNHLCPAELGVVFAEAFRRTDEGAASDLAVSLASFRRAVEADPSHVGANVEVLLALADEGQWNAVLDGAQRFIRSSRGHPYGLLISGLALQRLSRSEEADGQFKMALRVMAPSEASDLEDIRLLLGGEDEAYAAVSGDERKRWVDAFWAPLDPILSTSVNERRVEHVARAAYAILRFGGALTEPGEVWVRYGRPDEVRVFRENSGLRTEFWDYGNGPDITFRRIASSEDMSLTQESRAYLTDLLRVLPHRYGGRSRTVFSLPGQMSRFRGDVPGQFELEIHTEVPQALTTIETDTLEVGVFLISAEGERVGSTIRKIPARPAPLSFRAPIAAGVSSIVVEVFNRRVGQAAAFRRGVAALIPGEGGATISDLLLVEPTWPSGGDLDRRESWVTPETLARPLERDAFGVMFELYDVAESTSGYQIRVELVDRDTGRTRTLPSRPAGAEGFRTAWNRSVELDGPTRDFVTVALSDVPSGEYTVRVVVDVPESSLPLVATRNLDRR
jgi:TonB family protein